MSVRSLTRRAMSRCAAHTQVAVVCCYRLYRVFDLYAFNESIFGKFYCGGSSCLPANPNNASGVVVWGFLGETEVEHAGRTLGWVVCSLLAGVVPHFFLCGCLGCV